MEIVRIKERKEMQLILFVVVYRFCHPSMEKATVFKMIDHRICWSKSNP
jgi:hypothetical protein